MLNNEELYSQTKRDVLPKDLPDFLQEGAFFFTTLVFSINLCFKGKRKFTRIPRT